MDRFAVISDVHANLEALRAVLADIDACGVDEVICLGDLVGYGPDPVECVRIVRERCRVVLRGLAEHCLDGHTLLISSIYFKSSVEWSQRVLERDALSFLRSRTVTHVRGGDLLLHGTPRDPLEIIQLADFDAETREARDQTRLDEIFAAFERRLFVGNLQQPFAVQDRRFVFPAETDHVVATPPGTRTIIGVGSVGQPRDRDPRACWTLVEGDVVRWRRVDYDREETIRKMAAIPEFAPMFAFFSDRLRKGL